MAIDELSAAEAAELLKSDNNAVYLDVRTVREFEQGHALGAFNIPVMFMEPGEPAEPNTEFVDLVEKHFGQQRVLLVGCQSGVRSMTACRLLSQAGFVHLTNIAGGFGGARDRSGNILAAGWRDGGLPVSTSADGRGYDDLKD